MSVAIPPIRTWIFSAIGIACICAFFLVHAMILPRATTEVFSSPDETATMLFARAWNETGTFRIPHGLSAPIEHLVGLHARSMVRQGEWLVPVGFLGMPFLAAIVERLHQGWGAFMTVFLVLSSGIPLWFLTRRYFDARVAWWSVWVFLSFPTVLLYANRGLFPNLPVVAFVLWSVWLIRSAFESDRWKRALFGSLGGLALGLALLIRPIEAMWILPWIAWAGFEGIRATKAHGKKRWVLPCLSYCVALIVVIGYGAVLAKQTYPYHASWKDLPVAGYLLHDRGDAFAEVEQEDVVVTERSVGSLVPIGFHPRTMWKNVQVFLFDIFGLWVGMALLGYLVLQQRCGWRGYVPTALIVWTGGVLLLAYGQTSYADNINGTATIGNSFLRYLLPLAPLIAIGCAAMIERVSRIRFLQYSPWWRNGFPIWTIFGGMLVLQGSGIALGRDDEAILQTKRTLVRYASIRHQAERMISPGSLILSERSDKIFAGSFPVVSPLPDAETIRALAQSREPVLIFHRTPVTHEDVPEVLRGSYPVDHWATILRIDKEGLFYLVPPKKDP